MPPRGKKKGSKECFSLRLTVTFLTWFRFLFHSGGFPFWSVASCSLNLFSIWEAVSSEAVFPLDRSHFLAPACFFRGLAAATALAADPGSARQGSRPARPSTQSLRSSRLSSEPSGPKRSLTPNPCQGTNAEGPAWWAQPTLNAGKKWERRRTRDQSSAGAVSQAP